MDTNELAAFSMHLSTIRAITGGSPRQLGTKLRKIFFIPHDYLADVFD